MDVLKSKELSLPCKGVNPTLVEDCNAQIHALLVMNLSMSTTSKYNYMVSNGDGAMLWKLLCDEHELYTRKLQMSLRKEILNEHIKENPDKPWKELSQLIERISKSYARLCLISSEKISDQDLLAVLENAISEVDTYKDIRSWFKLHEPSTFQEAILHIKYEIADSGKKENKQIVPAEATKPAPPEEKYQYANQYNNGNYNNPRGRGRGRGRGRLFNRGPGPSQSIYHQNNQYVNNNNNNNKGNPGTVREFKCFNCGGMNHTKFECPSPMTNNYNNQQYRNGPRSFNNQQNEENLYVQSEEYFNVVTDCKSNQCEEETIIYLDSGASNHIFGNINMVHNIEQMEQPVNAMVANGNTVRINEVGQLRLRGFNNNNITISNVRACKSFQRNLISVSQLVNKGLNVIFNDREALVCRGDDILIRAMKYQNMFIISNEIMHPHPKKMTSFGFEEKIPAISKLDLLWHYRLGHCNIKTLQSMMNNNLIPNTNNMKELSNNLNQICPDCTVSKSTRKVFKEQALRELVAVHPMMRIFHDNSGMVNIPDVKSSYVKSLIKSLNTPSYLSLLVDENAGFLMGRPIHTKGESVQHIKDTVTLEENQTGYRCQVLNGDESGEIRSNELLQFLREKGIKRNLTNKATPQHNAIVERAMRTVFEATRAMLQHANLHNAYWGYAVIAAIYAINLTPSYRNPSKSRSELFRGYKSNTITKLHVFGCDAYVNVMKKDRASKVDNNAIPCIFLGYDEERENGYLFFDPEYRTIVKSRDAVFHEDKFTCGRNVTQNLDKTNLEINDVIPNNSINQNDNNLLINVTPYDIEDVNEGLKPLLDEKENIYNKNNPQPLLPRGNPIINADHEESEEDENDVVEFNHHNSNTNNSGNNQNSDSEGNQQPRRTSTRQKNYPAEYANYIPSNLLHLCVQETNTQPTEQYNLVEDGPPNYNEAINQDDAKEWAKACEIELKAHKDNNSWTLVPCNNTMNVIPSRWVFVIKIDPNNGTRKYKARFVVKGFKQQVGIDYFDDQISSSVLAVKSLRIMLTIAVINGYELNQMDAVSAFTQSYLQQDVYAEQPEGFEIYDQNNNNRLVCKLNKAVYGLKQASYLWQQDLRKFLIKQGWSYCRLDENLYWKYSKNNRIMLLGVYVDDIPGAYHPNDKTEFIEFIDSIQIRFKMKVIGFPQSILGMKLEYNAKDKIIKLSNEKYIDQILSNHNMSNAHPTSTPELQELLGPESCPVMESERREMQLVPYRKLVGELLYLMNTSRPDIAHAVGTLARFMENPGKKHWNAAKRVLRYLAGTKNIGIVMNGNVDYSKYHITAYSDADWGRDIHGRKSIYGYIIHLNGCPISWISKKQTFVAQSTCESEYVGMSEGIREIRWITQLLQELHIASNTPILYADNESAVKIASNTGMDNRIKSIDIKYHYIKDEVANKHVTIESVSTDNNIADIFTKPLGSGKFNLFRNSILGMVRD
jgi:hypothetical protein